jgi:hypothetical protein
VAAAGERDLARVATKVVTAAREHRVELTVAEVEGHEHSGIRAPADVEGDGLSGRKQHPRELIADRSGELGHRMNILPSGWTP